VTRPGECRVVHVTICAVIFLVSFFFPHQAHAHDPFETTTQVRLHPSRVEIRMIMARATAEELFGAEHIGTSANLAKKALPLEQLYSLKNGNHPLQLGSSDVSLGIAGEAQDDLVFSFNFSATPGNTLRLRAPYLEKLDQGYTGVVQVVEASSGDLLDIKVLHSADPWLDFKIPSPVLAKNAKVSPASPNPASNSAAQPFWMFLKVGIEHVVFGYDHLLFLLSVLLACVSLRQALGILTTFTVAHSVTLSLAIFHVVPLANNIVEPIIALSIAVAAFWGQTLEARKLLLPLTFAFGLIHGLGFAAGLQALADAGNVQLLGLVGFNLGVELGQVSAALILLPLLEWCRRSLRGQTALNWTALTVGAIGGGTFVWRIAEMA
jgi:HupE / UreJ protein